MGPALAKQIPVAFDVNEAREIDRALSIASEFGLDPIVVGASGDAALSSLALRRSMSSFSHTTRGCCGVILSSSC